VTKTLGERITSRIASVVRAARHKQVSIRDAFWRARDRFDRDEIACLIGRFMSESNHDGTQIAKLLGWEDKSSATRAKSAAISAIKYHRLRAKLNDKYQQAPPSEGLAVALMHALKIVRLECDQREPVGWQMTRELYEWVTHLANRDGALEVDQLEKADLAALRATVSAEVDMALRTARKYPFGGQVIDSEDPVILQDDQIILLSEDWLASWYGLLNQLEDVMILEGVLR
jgi:hypothetical protein